MVMANMDEKLLHHVYELRLFDNVKSSNDLRNNINQSISWDVRIILLKLFHKAKHFILIEKNVHDLQTVF